MQDFLSKLLRFSRIAEFVLKSEPEKVEQFRMSCVIFVSGYRLEALVLGCFAV